MIVVSTFNASINIVIDKERMERDTTEGRDGGFVTDAHEAEQKGIVLSVCQYCFQAAKMGSVYRARRFKSFDILQMLPYLHCCLLF